jgi:predicted nucleic acid-binding protein
MQVLVDTGPLVAISSPADQHHEECVKTLQTLKPPLLTCWPVITEAAWLLQGVPRAFRTLLNSFEQGLLEVPPITGHEAEAIAHIMSRYASLRPQFADATIVYLAHREEIETIFTLDRRDFTVYRPSGKSSFRLIPEIRSKR